MLLKNGFLINPKTHTQELTDIRILNGKISQISAGLVPEIVKKFWILPV